MAISLDSLIQDVEKRAPSPEPLALLATASATVSELNETTDALLSHFVDRSRRAGHSWSEIGEALGVSKQAVQKRFTAEQALPGAMPWTPRVRRLISKAAEKAARELQQPSVGTEALLLAMAGDPDGVAAHALADAGVDHRQIVSVLLPMLTETTDFVGGFTPEAWDVLEVSPITAVHFGHNYVGTEHVLVSLLSGPGAAGRALKQLGVKVEPVTKYVKKTLGTV